MVPSIGPKALPETLLLSTAYLLTIGEASVIDFTAPMVRHILSMMFSGTSMMLPGTSMMFSSVENITEMLFDSFGML